MLQIFWSRLIVTVGFYKTPITLLDLILYNGICSCEPYRPKLVFCWMPFYFNGFTLFLVERWLHRRGSCPDRFILKSFWQLNAMRCKLPSWFLFLTFVSTLCSAKIRYNASSPSMYSSLENLFVPVRYNLCYKKPAPTSSTFYISFFPGANICANIMLLNANKLSLLFLIDC